MGRASDREPTNAGEAAHAHAALGVSPWQRAWRALLVLGILMTAWLAWMPHQLPVLPNQSDKLKHAMAFASLGLAAWHAYPGDRLRVFLKLLGFGLLIELVQAALPTRSAEAADLLADAVGLTVAALAGRLSAMVRPLSWW